MNVQMPHIPTVVWAVGIGLLILGCYHLVHKH